MKNLFILVLAFAPTYIMAQVTFDLYSGMDGSLVLENGASTNFWGYGFIGDEMSLPAPFLNIPLDSDVTINMTNTSPESHTIHLHGLDVDQVNDGVPQTSFFIAPNESGTYQFNANQSGTFLYHCHVTTTLHLTMGMYGMITVNAPNNKLFPGGPGFIQEFKFLTSDLDVSVNNAPALAYPFHTIRPDYFMINGLSGDQITSDQGINTFSEGATALRIGSMAYSRIVYHFPEELNAVAHMSDGRPIPAFEVTELEVYPGERFSLIINPFIGFSEPISVEYYSMITGELLATNFIPVNDLGVNIHSSSLSDNGVYPNPSHGMSRVFSSLGGKMVIFAPTGRMLNVYNLREGDNFIDLSAFSSGIYLMQMPDGSTLKLIRE
ncbi:MAG: multicopper oxidase domain-containing protein [Flavobacteriales bacterium]|nr:multicopper oxidase domain-containing protein [Flavobacteriales bacterium]